MSLFSGCQALLVLAGKNNSRSIYYVISGQPNIDYEWIDYELFQGRRDQFGTPLRCLNPYFESLNVSRHYSIIPSLHFLPHPLQHAECLCCGDAAAGDALS